MVPDQGYRTTSNQRLQTVGVAAQTAEHPEAPAAGVLVLGEVVQQPRHDACADQRGAGVAGVGETGQQQQDGRLGCPGFGVVGVVVGCWLGHRGGAVQGDLSEAGG